MTMQSILPEETLHAQMQEQKRRRFGLFPVKVGAMVLHRIGIPMPLDTPMYDARNPHAAVAAKVRTRIPAARLHRPQYERGVITQNGISVEVPVKALTGTAVYLEVQPFDRLTDDERAVVKWCCNHHECAGKRWESAEEVHQAHAKDSDLIKAAEQAPLGWAGPHMYFGVIEIPGVDGKDEVKDASTGKVTQRKVEAVPPTIMIVSNEE